CAHHARLALRADRPRLRAGAPLRPRGPPPARRRKRGRQVIVGLAPLLTATIGFAYVGGLGVLALGIAPSGRRRRLPPLLLVCVAAASFSWIEAPYDWAMYAQFPPAIPRMPSWWPLDMTWGGLPASVPPGYISYFVLPALVA